MKKGFTIIEVVVVPAILLMVVLAVMNAFNMYIKISKNSLNTVKASYLLDEGVEVVKMFRDISWNQKIVKNQTDVPFRVLWNLNSFATTSSTTLIDGIFDRTIILSSVYRDNTTKDISSSGTIDDNTRKVTVSVSWNDGSGTTTKSLSAYITNMFSN
jgi:prepilin-type N-terminal cleavage/methylation domain-containing protein